MTIKTGQSTGVVAVLTSDTVGDVTPAGESHEHYAAYAHNTSSSSSITVEGFISADSSSALAERVFEKTLSPDEDMRLPVITIDESSYFLLKAGATGVNFHSTFTKRNGEDK